MSDSSKTVSNTPEQPFLDWVNRKQWRVNSLLGAFVLMAAAILAFMIAGSYAVAHLFGDQVLYNVIEGYAPSVTGALVTNEVLGGETLFSGFTGPIYFIIALAIVISTVLWQDKITPSERIVRGDGVVEVRQTGPNVPVWSIVLLGIVVPALAGLITGFW